MGGPKQGSSRLRALAGIVALSGVLVGVAPAPVSAASSLAPTTTHHVTPQEKEFPGDRACPAGTTLVKDQFQSVTQGVETGTASRSYDIGGTTVTVTLTLHADNTFDFAIDNGVAAHVFVKGSNYLLYQYAPPVAGATNSGAVSSDTGLHSGYVSGDSYQDVSHLDFCLSAERPSVALQATTTATATFTRTITWSLDKSVTPASHTGAAGEDAGTSTWTVVANKTQTLSNFQVTGTVSVTNGNNFPVAFAVAESLTGGIPVTVNCVGSATPNEGTAPANGSVDCTYAVTPANDLATLVTAVVTPADSAIGAVTATAPVSFTANVIGDNTVTVDDNRDTEGQFPASISSSTTFDYDETFPCSSNPADYTNGVDVDTYPNTATLTGANTNLSDSATVTVTCSLAPVVATKTAAATYDRTVEWALDKSVAPASHSGTAGDPAGTSTWTVEATKSETLGNYEVTGSITIDNSAAIPRSFTVTDVLNDGTVAAVDCNPNTAGNQASGTLQADGSVTCQYTALPEDDSATLNTATVSVSGNPNQTATAAVAFTENVIGDDTVTVDDNRDSEGQFPDGISTSTTFDYDETFPCSSNPADYTNGVDVDTYPNTATLTGDNTNLSDSATVTVTCSLAPVTATKTATGTYDRTVEWTLDKSVAPTSHNGTAGNAAGTSTWTVVATKSETLGNFRVTGSITIDNPTGVPQSFTVTDVLNDGTVAAVDCDAATTGNQSFGTLLADGAMTCQYTALPEDDSATLNTATVSVSGNPDQTATVAVAFTENVIGDDTVTVDDDRDTEGQFPKAISSSTTFDYDETFRCSAISSDYANFTNQRTETNTATLTGPDTDLSDSAAVDITCTLPPASVDVTKTVAGNAATWSFDFTIAPVPAGETATKSATNAAPTVGWDGLMPGTSYTITETNVAGFITGTLTCTGGTNTVGASSFTPTAGQAVACAITNDVVEQQAPPIADIAVVKTATPTVVTPGGNVTWTLVATNNGPNPADNATIVDNLPAALTLVSFTAPAGWDCSGSVTGNPGKLSCTKPTMGVNESGTFTLSTTVAAAAAGTTISNIAVVSTTTTETTTSNNQDPEPITVQIAVLPPTGGYVWNRVAIAAGLVLAGCALAAVDRRRRFTS